MARVIGAGTDHEGGLAGAKNFSMTVQLPLTGKWGTEDEKQAYDRVEDAIAAGFEANDFGDFDGNDFGSGTVNLFVYPIPPARWDEALRFVLDTLKAHGLLD